MNVLIVGGNFINKGSEVMMMTVQQEITARCRNAKFYLLCRDYEKEMAQQNNFIPLFDVIHPSVVLIKAFMDRVEGKLLKTFTGKNKGFVFPFPFKSIKKQIKTLDIVIDISGFAYGDSWGLPVIRETIKLQKFCEENYKSKYYFLPQAWGGFESHKVAEAASEMLMNADKFYARDHISRNSLASLLKKEIANIPCLNDIAFLYKGNPEVNASSLIHSLNDRNNKRLLIGISPNYRIYERTEGKGLNNTYIKLLLKLSDHCLSRLGADVLLIPSELFPDARKAIDDRFLCRMLQEIIDSPKRCFFLDRYCSADEIKSLIGQVDILISSRFHAIIFGLLHAIPVMAVSWSHKYEELLSTFNMGEFVLEMDADQEYAVRKLDLLLNKKEEIHATILSMLGDLTTTTGIVFNEIVITSEDKVL